MARMHWLRLLPFLTLGCSVVAGFEEFSAKDDGSAEVGGAGGSSGTASGKGGTNASSGGTPNGKAGTGGTSNRGGTDASGGTAGAASAAGGASGSTASGASGGSVGSEGGEGGTGNRGGAFPAGGSGGTTAGSGQGGAGGQGGSSGSGGSAGFAGEATCGELLANGDFDQGPTPEWQEYVSYSDSLRIVLPQDDEYLVAEGVEPESGEYLAWLGGIPDNEERHHVSRLHQLVRIPARTSRLTLSGWLWIRTLEPEADGMYDESYAQIVEVHSDPGDSTVIHQFHGWSNLDAANVWAYFEFDTTELDSLRDRILTLEVYSRTDLDYETSFWFDSLSLFAECDR